MFPFLLSYLFDFLDISIRMMVSNKPQQFFFRGCHLNLIVCPVKPSNRRNLSPNFLVRAYNARRNCLRSICRHTPIRFFGQPQREISLCTFADRYWSRPWLYVSFCTFPSFIVKMTVIRWGSRFIANAKQSNRLYLSEFESDHNFLMVDNFRRWNHFE